MERGAKQHDRLAARLETFGLGDVYGGIGITLASVAFGMSLLCCGGADLTQSYAPAFVGTAVVAAWCGGYGVVLRGTPVGRGLAWLALILSLGSVLLGFWASIFHSVLR